LCDKGYNLWVRQSANQSCQLKDSQGLRPGSAAILAAAGKMAAVPGALCKSWFNWKIQLKDSTERLN
jgi:hypothetical protein